MVTDRNEFYEDRKRERWGNTSALNDKEFHNQTQQRDNHTSDQTLRCTHCNIDNTTTQEG